MRCSDRAASDWRARQQLRIQAILDLQARCPDAPPGGTRCDIGTCLRCDGEVVPWQD